MARLLGKRVLRAQDATEEVRYEGAAGYGTTAAPGNGGCFPGAHPENAVSDERRADPPRTRPRES